MILPGDLQEATGGAARDITTGLRGLDGFLVASEDLGEDDLKMLS